MQTFEEFFPAQAAAAKPAPFAYLARRALFFIWQPVCPGGRRLPRSQPRDKPQAAEPAERPRSIPVPKGRAARGGTKTSVNCHPIGGFWRQTGSAGVEPAPTEITRHLADQAKPTIVAGRSTR